MSKITANHFKSHLERLSEYCHNYDLSFEILEVYTSNDLFKYLARRINKLSKKSGSLTVILDERENDDDIPPSIYEHTGIWSDDGEQHIDSEKAFPNEIVLELYHRDLINSEKLCTEVAVLFMHLVFEVVRTKYDLENVDITDFDFKSMYSKIDGYRKEFIMKMPLE